MILTEEYTYEKIYLSLWELAKRYQDFTQFRVIGSSHDDRMIPMLELGTGDTVVLCLSGTDPTQQQMPRFLLQMAEEYCRAYECGWQLGELYDVNRLLEKVRLCIIPLLNPDGYEIVRNGYSSIHNPIYRQMLRMQQVSPEEFTGNARGIELGRNFPTSYYQRKQRNQEPASENETKALIHIFQEYKSRGLLSFCQSENRIVYYRQCKGIAYNQRSYRLARHLQKCSCYHLEKNQTSTGSPEQFYAEIVKQPSILVESAVREPEEKEKQQMNDYEEIHLLPLEYIYSLEE